MTDQELTNEAGEDTHMSSQRAQDGGGHGRRRTSSTERVARRYFEAIDAHDVDAAVALWAPGGRENVRGQTDTTAPDGVRTLIEGLIKAMPDMSMEVLGTTTERERCAVHFRIRGTFAGSEPMNGVAPTGEPILMEGVDVLSIKDGLVHTNESFPDALGFARQVGLMPPQGSTAEQALTGVFNVKTRLTRLPEPDAKLIAEGVWALQGQPGRCNVYLIEDESVGGITLYDAGARTMVRAVASAGAKLGGIKRVVLGHGHTDHRGVAPALGVPVLCHPEEVQDAEGSGGFRYWPKDLVGLPMPQRQIHRALHRFAWDGGPVQIAETVSEHDRVGDFEVIHLPGHAPGLIGLWRERDRLALVSDCFYTLDIWGRSCPPHVPMRTYNYDTAQAKASILKLAEMEPAAAWPGHAKPVTGDVRTALLTAAQTE
jgi:hydroxyacylglutathione hydrolase